MRHFWQEEMAFYIHFLIGDLETPNGRAAVHDALKSHSVLQGSESKVYFFDSQLFVEPSGSLTRWHNVYMKTPVLLALQISGVDNITLKRRS